MSASKFLSVNEFISLLDEDLAELSELSYDDDDDVQMLPPVMHESSDDEFENDAEVYGKSDSGSNNVVLPIINTDVSNHTVDQILSTTASQGDRNASASRSGCRTWCMKRFQGKPTPRIFDTTTIVNPPSV